MSNGLWDEFYFGYSDIDTDLPDRLKIMRSYIKEVLPNSNNILSICGGKSLDILDLLDSNKILHIVDNDIDAATYIEENAITPVKFLLKDAEISNSYIDIPKVELLICSGFIGAITKESIKDFVSFLPNLIKENSIIVWTLKNDDFQHVEYVKSIFKSFDFIELDSQITKNNRFTCVKSQFIGEQLDLLPNQKIMSMSW